MWKAYWEPTWYWGIHQRRGISQESVEDSIRLMVPSLLTGLDENSIPELVNWSLELPLGLM